MAMKTSFEAETFTSPEPTLHELLSDHACQLLMLSDGISSKTVTSLINQLRTTWQDRWSVPDAWIHSAR